jgi:hypothetical protein
LNKTSACDLNTPICDFQEASDNIKTQIKLGYNITINTSSLETMKKLKNYRLRLNIFRLFVILSLTQLYRYTPKIFLFSTATFKYKYRAPLRRIGQENSKLI